MLDIDTFVTTVYVFVDDFCKSVLPTQSKRPGPASKLSRSEVLTLAIISQWSRWRSERDFYRFAQSCLRSAFPSLPERSRYNRLVRRHCDAVTLCGLYIATLLGAQHVVVEALDCTAVPVRNSHRRGAGWLCGLADIGHSSRLGWINGFRLLVSVGKHGTITGYCIGAASTNDRSLAETFFALRQQPSARVPSVGTPARGAYVADMGFAGKEWQPRWQQQYNATVIARRQKEHWPRAQRRWLAHTRQIVETVFEKLHHVFGLSQERPHQLDGLLMRLAAKVTLHNFCIWINLQLGRNPLQTADLLGWA